MEGSLINKFLENSISEKEKEKLLEWLRSPEAEKDIDREIENYFKSGGANTIIWNDRQVFEKIIGQIKNDKAARLKFLKTRAQNKPGTKGLASFPVYLLKIAAAVIIILTTVYSVYHFSYPGETVKKPSPQTIVKQTERGQKLSFYLSDGSKVMLNSSSKIEFSSMFDGPQRKVTFSGEAYFEIAKDPDKPFIVQTGEYETVVLGTTFIVKAKENSEQISVALKSGKVLVQKQNMAHAAGEKIHLTPGNVVTIDLGTGKKTIKPYHSLSMFGWTSGTLFFKDTDFTEVISRLEEWYDVEIRIGNYSEIEKKYSGIYENESLENVLKGLSYINQFEYDINGKNVTINFKKQ